MPKQVIMIGAGILGAAAAYELSKRGATVTVVDQEAAGQATAAAAGIICPWLTKRRNQAWYKLAKNGAAHYQTLISDLGEQEIGYKKVGALFLDSEVEKLEQLMEIAMKRREDAPEMGDITLLSKEETTSKFPLLSEEFHALYVSGGGRVDGRAIRNALLKAADVSVVQGKAILLTENRKVIGVTVDGKRYDADETIAVNGVWMNELLDGLETKITFQAQKGEIVHMKVNHLLTDDLPVVKPPNNQYLLSFTDGRIVAGATRKRVTQLDHGVSAGGLHNILNEALKVAPGLASSTIIETRTGFRPFTKNHLPVFGRLPNYDGIFIANGLGASGLTTGPYIGKLLAQMISGEETSIDVTPYQITDEA